MGSPHRDPPPLPPPQRIGFRALGEAGRLEPSEDEPAGFERRAMLRAAAIVTLLAPARPARPAAIPAGAAPAAVPRAVAATVR
jgi:hypothetical protein